jgi:hypothetical protein
LVALLACWAHNPPNVSIAHRSYSFIAIRHSPLTIFNL